MKQNGFAALLLIFVLGMVGMLVASSLVLTGYNESQMARTGASGTSAYYVANSGIEDAIYKIRHITDYGLLTVSYTIPVDHGSAAVTVSPGADAKERLIDAVGTIGPYVSRIRAVVQNTSVIPGFPYAVHAGSGGFEMENNAIVTGDVYAMGDIMGGSSNNNCTGNPSMIQGVATSSGTFTTLPDGSGNGVCTSSDAYGKKFNACFIKGTAFYVQLPVACSNAPPTSDISGTIPSPIAPIPFPISDGQIDDVTKHIKQTYTGNCYVGGPQDTPGCYTKEAVTNIPIVGGVRITGALTISSSNIKFSGPVWVSQDMMFTSNVTIGLTADLTDISQMIVVDDRIIAKANINFIPNTGVSGDKVYLLPISRFDPRSVPGFTGDICRKDNPDTTINSIYVQSNINDVLFYAPHGCLYIKGVGGGTYFGSAIGEKILLGGGTLTYDTALVKAEFGTTRSGGWQIASFNQR